MLEPPIGRPDPHGQAQPMAWKRLDDLAPLYEHNFHGSYLLALVQGVESGRATNIALSGPYGSGKSSILDGLVHRYARQTVQVSLATVRPVAETINTTQPSVSANELQKEIVKQILYVVDPVKTPASRFSRVTRFRWARAMVWALAAGLAGVSVQWLVTIVLALARGTLNLTWAPEAYLPTFLATGLLLFVLLRLTNGRLAISDLTAGPAKLTLSDKKGSYFDDYLDEIVYFFQASKKRIVIIEDMERFSNVEVFEDLRALNVLLNHAAQLKSSRLHRVRHFWRRLTRKTAREVSFDPSDVKESFLDGPIVFIYAIRDSLLTTRLQTTDDVRHDAFTRAKFFDLIVPVVPFVTQQNARGALKKELELLAGEHERKSATSTVPSDGLVRSIAQYCPDQRQIRNIRNEFSMYRERLLQPNKHPAELTPNRMLALVLYKNLEVADFERIRLGKGQLYRVLGFSRALVTTNLERISAQLNGPTQAALELQAEELCARVKSQASALGIEFQKQVQTRYQPTYEAMSVAELGSLQLWRQVAGGESLYCNGKRLDRCQLENVFAVSLDFADPNSTPVDSNERHQLEEDRAFLEQATWARLWSAPQFTLGTAGRTDYPKLGPEIVSTERSFAQIVTDVLGEGLAADLIAKDHLTQNFALLSASYDVEFLGLEAQDFVTRVMEQPGRQPLDFISQRAVAQIIAEKGEAILERAGMVNIHVLNYLLAERPNSAHRVIAQLRSWTPHDQAVLRDFLERYGADAALDPLQQAVAYLIELAPSAVELLATDAAVPEDRRPALFDTAISHVRAGALPDAIATSPSIQQFARDNQQSLASLTRDEETATRAALCIAQLGVQIDDVTPLSAAARDVLVPRGMFALNVPNLRALTGREPDAWVSLEDLRDYEDLYRSTLRRIAEYLELTADGTKATFTVISPEALKGILTDLDIQLADTAGHIDLLRRVTARADQSATVEDITDLDGPVQDALLFEQRALPTTGNLIARLASAGEVTESVAKALHDMPRPTVTDDNLSEFTNQVIKASRRYPALLTPTVISEFVSGPSNQVDLEPQSVLQADDFAAIRLIDEGRVDVTATREAATPSIAWKVREALLASEPVPDAEELASLVQAEDARAFIGSVRIPNTVRAAAPMLLDTLLTGGHRTPNANVIAEYLLQESVPTKFEQVLQLAQAGVTRRVILELLLRDPTVDDFVRDPVSALHALGGDYAALSDRGVTKSPTFPSDAIHQRFLEHLAQRGMIRNRGAGLTGRLRVHRLYPGS